MNYKNLEISSLNILYKTSNLKLPKNKYKKAKIKAGLIKAFSYFLFLINVITE